MKSSSISIDFKKGVEFKTYATHHLPHARAIAVESDREFGLSVLQRLDAELTRRGELFRKAGVQDLASYREAPGQTMPRTLLIIDEFQEFFTEDDKLAQDAGLLLDRLVRQGRAFGIHVLLGSQTIGGSSGLSRSTIGQIGRPRRPANQRSRFPDRSSATTTPPPDCSPAPAKRSTTTPADSSKATARSRSPGCPMKNANDISKPSAPRPSRNTNNPEPPIVFEGNAPADYRKNPAVAGHPCRRRICGLHRRADRCGSAIPSPSRTPPPSPSAAKAAPTS